MQEIPESFKKIEKELRDGIKDDDPAPVKLTEISQRSLTPKAAYAHWFNKYFYDKNTLSDITNKYGSKHTGIIRTVTLIKLGWRAGKTTAEIKQELNIRNPSRVKIFNACLRAIAEEVEQWDTEGIYSEFAERKRGLIRRLEGQLQRIEDHWHNNPNSQQLHREYTVIIKIISDIEDSLIKEGYELGIFGKKGDDKTFTLKIDNSMMPQVPQLEDKSGRVADNDAERETVHTESNAS